MKLDLEEDIFIMAIAPIYPPPPPQVCLHIRFKMSKPHKNFLNLMLQNFKRKTIYSLLQPQPNSELYT